MRFCTRSKVAALLLVSWFQAVALAQHGHPLVGTWSGDWGVTAENRNRVLLLLEYDGNEVTGIINPGPNPVVLTSATLDPSTWTVSLAATGEDAEGNPVAYSIEGKIENLGSTTQRTIVGTWIEGETRGDFRVTLN